MGGCGHNAAVLFERRLQAGLRDGTITVVFRRWKRAQVVAGRRYRSPIGLVEVSAVATVSKPISDADAQAAGYASAAEVIRDLKGPPDGDVYRLELKCSQSPDPRSVLAEDAALEEPSMRALEAKLARLDAAGGRAWTRPTLEAIQQQPGRRAGDLAVQLGWDKLLDFKLHVRRLKALGLTRSLPIGYELSPRGTAYLQQCQLNGPRPGSTRPRSP